MTSREDALARLSSPLPSRRAQAASELATLGSKADLDAILRSQAAEPVPQVRKRLGAAIRAIESREERAATSPEVSIDAPVDLSVEVMENIERIVLHELDPAIGVLELALEDEMPELAGSRTSRAVSNLVRQVNAVSKLTAANPYALSPEPVDLASLVLEVASNVGAALQITEDSSEVAEVVTDRDLIQTIISNALLNAKEASAGLEAPATIEVSLVVTEDAFELSIVNPVAGVPAAPGDLKRRGFSTKGHDRGLGLIVVRRSAEVLGLQTDLDILGQRATFVLSGPRVHP